MRAATKNIVDEVPRVSGGYGNPVAGPRRGQAQRSMRRGLHRGVKDERWGEYERRGRQSPDGQWPRRPPSELAGWYAGGGLERKLERRRKFWMCGKDRYQYVPVAFYARPVAARKSTKSWHVLNCRDT